MAYGFSKYNQYSTSYQNKRRAVRSIYQPQHLTGSGVRVSRFAGGQSEPSQIKEIDTSYVAEKKRSTLDRIFDALQVGQFVVQGAISGAIDDDPNTNPFTGVWEGLKGANPFGDDYTAGEFSFSDNIRNLYGEPRNNAEKIGYFIAGLAGDVALDPLTYMTLGTSALTKGTGTVRKIGGATDDVIRALTKADAYKILSNHNIPRTAENINKLVASTNKYAGIAKEGPGLGIKIGKFSKTFIDDKTLRLFADKTTAPYVNRFVDYVQSSKAMQFIDKSWSLKQLAKKNPNEAAKLLLALDMVGGKTDAILKSNASIKNRIKKMTSEFTPDELVELTRLIEDSSAYGKTAMKIDVNDSIAAKKLFDSYNNRLTWLDSKIAKLQDEISTHPTGKIGELVKAVDGERDTILEKYANLKKIREELVKSKKELEDITTIGLPVNRRTIEVRESFLPDKPNPVVEPELEPLNFTTDSPAPKKDLRRFYKPDDKSIDIPYGIIPISNFTRIQSGSLDLGETIALRSTPASEYLLKGKVRQPRGTSNKFVRTKLDDFSSVSEKDARELVSKLIKNNPLLAKDFERIPLSSTLSKAEAEKFLKLYMDEPADVLLSRLDEFKEGYYEAQHILTAQGYGRKVTEAYERVKEAGQLLAKQKIGSAESKALNEHYGNLKRQADILYTENKARLARLLIDEDARIADWAELISKREIPYTDLKVQKAQASISNIRYELDVLQSRMAAGVDDEALVIKIGKLQSKLKKEMKIVEETFKVSAWAKDYDAGNWLTKGELDEILKKEGLVDISDNPYSAISNDFKHAIDDAYFDSRLDLPDEPRKPYVDPLRNKKAPKEKAMHMLEGLSQEEKDLALDLHTKIYDDIAKLDKLKKKHQSDLSDGLGNPELYKSLEDEIHAKIGQNINLVKELHYKAVELNGGISSKARPILEYLQKNAYTTAQADEIAALLGRDSVYDSVTRIAKQVERTMMTHFDYKINLLKQYFPEKTFSDLTEKELNYIEGLTNEAVKRGEVRPAYSGKNKAMRIDRLRELDVKIKNVDYELATLEERVNLIKNGYFFQNTENGRKAIQAAEDFKQLDIKQTSLDNLIAARERITAGIDASNIETFLKSTLSEEQYDSLLTVMTGKEGFFDPDVEKRFGAVARAFKEDMAEAANLENLGFTWDNYVLHLVKDEYKGRFYKDQEFTELASKLGIGREQFNTSQLKRQFKMTIEEYKRAWDAGEIYNKKKFPRDLFEENAARLWVDRMLKTNKLINDRANHNIVLDLVGRKLPKDRYLITSSDFSSLIGEGEVLAISTRDLINFEKETKKINTYLTSIGEKEKPMVIEILQSQFNPNYDKLRDGFFEFTVPPNLSDLPEEVASVVNNLGIITSKAATDVMNYGSKFQYSNGVRAFLDLYDKMLHLWKLNVTAVNPNFHIRNMIGNTFNNYLDIGTDVFNPEYRSMVMDIVKGTQGELVTKSGKTISYDELYSIAQDLDVLNTGQFGIDIRGILEHKGKVGDLSKFNPLDSTEFLPYKAGTKVGAAIEAYDRMLNFVWHVRDGKSYSHAQELTNHFLFDYSKSTEFEKEVLRRVIPFWTWLKNNAPLQAQQMLEQPSKYMPFAKMKTATTNSLSEEDRVDRNYVNDFALDWWQMPFTVINEEGRIEPVMLNPNMPYQDVSTDLKDLIGKLSPFIKVPYEIATNRHSFYEQPIYDGILDAPVKTVDHIFSQLTPYNVGKSVIRKSGTDRLLEIIAYFGGVRLMSYDAEKYKYMMMQEQLRGK